MPGGRFEELEAGGERARLYGSGDESSPGVVVFHAWWGLNDDVIAYADRLAGAGFSVRAPDLVRGRVATTTEDAERLVSDVDERQAETFALATIDRFVGTNPSAKIGVVGFSFGAGWAIWCAAQRPAVAASVVYYGTTSGSSIPGSSAPVLGHFAESDPYEPDEAVADFERTLEQAGRSVVIHRYAGAGHWFAEPSREAWRRHDADLAFERTVAFLRAHVGAVGSVA
jgi:carboxymethylenebutenolidase